MARFIIKYLIIVCMLIKPLLSFADIKFLNVSYDPTREFYHEYNKIFGDYWYNKTKQKISFEQSHGGSGKQARSVIDGLEGDVVTLALGYDIDAISKKSDLIDKNWQQTFKNNSSPYTSTIVFLVRKNNPKNIKDWDDLAHSDIQVITPNPKISGGARWGYLGAWTYGLKKYNNEYKAKELVEKIFANVKIFDSGARASLMTFSKRNIGDVLITWENEAFLAKKNSPDLEIITPSISILAEPPVAIITKNAIKHKTQYIAKAYLGYLYSDIGQHLVAKHFYRPQNPQILKQYNYFQASKLYTVKDIFGSWDKAHKEHFANGALFDFMMLKRLSNEK